MGLFGPDKKDLWTAASNGDAKKIKDILSKGIPVDTPAENGNTALIMACGRGFVDAVSVLIDNGADINCKTTNGYTPLMSACHGATQPLSLIKGKFLEVIELLISKGADVNQTSKGGNSPLILAAETDSTIVKCIIDAGADVNRCVPTTKITPLMLASLYGKEKTVQLLIKSGVDINAKDQNNETALFYACSSTPKNYSNYLTSTLTQFDKDAIKDFVRKQKHVSGPIISYNLSAPEGFEKDIYDIVNMLLKAGANFKLKNASGLKPIEIAFKAGNTDLVDLLTRKGANV